MEEELRRAEEEMEEDLRRMRQPPQLPLPEIAAHKNEGKKTLSFT